ncbi:hypothetical protein D3C86_2065420 [compost metagenome]
MPVVSSSVVNVPTLVVGSSLAGVIVTVTVAALESTVPSFTLKVNVSVPVAFAFGT